MAAFARLAWHFDRRPQKPRVALQTKGFDAALFLLQMFRSAGLVNLHQDLNEKKPKAREVLQLVRDLFKEPIIAPADFRSATGLLLSSQVFLARNWTYSLDLVYSAKKLDLFALGPGLGFDGTTDPSNLLGGELLALPWKAWRPWGRRRRPLATDLMEYLISEKVQQKVVRELSWPVMRADIEGQLLPWQEDQQAVIEEALAYAEATPRGWSRQMAEIYKELFLSVTRHAAEPPYDTLLDKTVKALNGLAVAQN